MTAEREQDWGDSEGAALAHAKEQNSHRRFERLFQLWVLISMLVFAIVLIVLDWLIDKSYVKDLLPYLLPVFTFLIGKDEGEKK